MPTFESAPTYSDFQSFTSVAEIDDKNLTESVERASGVNRSGILGTVGSMIGFGAVDLVDTVASSVGLTDRGEFAKGVVSSLVPQEMQKYYYDNKGAIEVGSGLAAVVATDWGAGRILKPTGAVMRFVKGKPYVGALAKPDQKYEHALRVATAANVKSARAVS